MTGGWSGGQACRPAAFMAIDDVNERDDVLPGYKITLVDKDSRVSGEWFSEVRVIQVSHVLEVNQSSFD